MAAKIDGLGLSDSRLIVWENPSADVFEGPMDSRSERGI